MGTQLIAPPIARRARAKRDAGTPLSTMEERALAKAERLGALFDEQPAAIAAAQAVVDPTTPEEQAQLAAEEVAHAYDVDEALQERGGDDDARATVVVESYDYGHDGSVDSSIRAARASSGSGPLATDALTPQKIHQVGVPQSMHPIVAPLPGDSDAPAGLTIDSSRPPSRRDSPVEQVIDAPDELDQLLGSAFRRENASFEQLRNKAYAHRFVFRRHYYKVGVLIDSFPDVSKRSVAEFSERAAAIEAYNRTVEDSRERLGYCAHVVGTLPSVDDIKRALSREVASQIQRTEALANVSLDPNVVHHTGGAGMPVGFARVGLKQVALEGGRFENVSVFHDARKGRFLVRAGSIDASGRSLAEAEANLREQLIPA